MSQTADAGSRGSSELLPLRPLCQGWASQGPTELAPGHRCPPWALPLSPPPVPGLALCSDRLGGLQSWGLWGQQARGFCLAASTCPRAESSFVVPPFPQHCHPFPSPSQFLPKLPGFLLPDSISHQLLQSYHLHYVISVAKRPRSIANSSSRCDISIKRFQKLPLSIAAQSPNPNAVFAIVIKYLANIIRTNLPMSRNNYQIIALWTAKQGN